MKKILILFAGLLLIIPFTIIQASASEEYIIKKGDTLWDISGDILNDNFLWPKIWKANPQIKNPDLIYPGERIIIPTKEELRRLELPVKKAKPVVEKAPPAPETTTKAEVVEERPVRYLLDKNLYIASGWISEDFPSIGQIVASPSERMVFGNNEIVYLRLNRKVTKGERFLIIRDIKKVSHPRTGRTLGHQIRVAGILEVTGIKDDTPVAEIVDIFEEVQIGDGLMPYDDMEPPLMPEDLRRPDIDGYIVESRINNRAISAGDIIYLDKGEEDGLEVGDVFDVLSSTPIKTTIGSIQVISLKPSTSTAIVLKSRREIAIGDRWGNATN
jgi:hypothetical protein